MAPLSSIAHFLNGALFLGHLVIGLFFWRFYAKTKDRLFGCFAAAFWLLAVERLLIFHYGPENLHVPAVYLTRLIAFLLIIAAIVSKNRRTDAG
ncbi:MAG TPA: DUF5985 family protein [Opitutaceae bacterium]|jgi:hypothetical protein|nr:DUF5985 family protein [Opitutaceae bacterium]